MSTSQGQLFPKAVQPYVKAWVSLIGVVVAAVVTAVGSVPTWVTIVGAGATTIGVFMGRNSEPDTPPSAVQDVPPTTTDN